MNVYLTIKEAVGVTLDYYNKALNKGLILKNVCRVMQSHIVNKNRLFS